MDESNLYSASSLPVYDMAIEHTADDSEDPITKNSGSFDPYAQMNSHSFIFRLPTEILESIFIDCARDYHSKDDAHPTPTVPSWVNVSYVCRHWRNVALHCPILWTYLFVTSERWTEELLVRSKQAPLSLRLETDHRDKEPPVLSFLEQVMSHVERIQEVLLDLDLPSLSNHVFLSKLSSPAPRLQLLRISTRSFSSELFSVLFDGDTPALRTLELSNCPMPWSSFKLSGLTTLGLYDVPVWFQQDTNKFLATLSCMQDLTHLGLDGALASAAGFLHSTAFQTFQKINLPRLSSLFISAPLSTVIVLLLCINIPLKTKVRLHCDLERGSSLDDYARFSTLAKRLNMFEEQAPSMPTIRSLGIATLSPSRSTILLFGAAERDYFAGMTFLNSDRNIPLRISIPSSRSITRNNWESIICGICCSLPLTNIQSLHVVSPQFSSGFWRKILGHLQDLRHFKLSEGDMPDVASLLSCSPHSDNADRGPNRIFAPVLETLELYKIRFAPKPPPECDTHARVVIDVQSLYNALSTRRESPGRLTMTKCSISFTSSCDTKFDMVRRWEDGHLHIVEEGSAAKESAH